VAIFEVGISALSGQSKLGTPRPMGHTMDTWRVRWSRATCKLGAALEERSREALAAHR